MSAHSNLKVVEGLEPAGVWRLFAGMADVPRPSKHEEKIREHVRRTAEGMGFAVRQDRVGNMVIEVPASAGRENAAITVLQGHLDMVPEKNTGTEHDFEQDPIRLVLDKDPQSAEPIVRADQTTLGADNGIGVALALAAASSPDVIHGPLEILCTTDEEAGMTGAGALTPESFKGRCLLNLDSEEDDALYIGCAGGCDSTLAWDFPLHPIGAGAEVYRVTVAGLRGGHSGSNINENRGNAIKLLARTLSRADVPGLQIARIAGGSKRNAIPREASAVVVVPAGGASGLQATADAVREEAVAESPEPNLSLSIEPAAAADASTAISSEYTKVLIDTIRALPHGVLEMHRELAGLVQTSNNVATVTAGRDAAMHVEVGALSRSSSSTRLQATLDQIAAVGRLAGASVRAANSYPSWAPNMESPILATCRRVYAELFGEEPKVAAIHAGLECGIIGQRVGSVDMVSFGPRIEGAHSPEERVYVDSVRKSWQYLIAVLAELARG
ncbi:MAG TPA: beta-Ala-His dipeptidase [Phycisphaerae bacterium]|nr:beta-Ala-His dipeptidase [Phycisphaerae bacterium]